MVTSDPYPDAAPAPNPADALPGLGSAVAAPGLPPMPDGGDSIKGLSPTAARLVAAARDVLIDEGFTGMTLDAVTGLAGENKASVKYHFGNKAGLVMALVDSVEHDDNLKLVDGLKGKPGSDRLDVLMDVHREGCRDIRNYRAFWELLPHLLRDEAMRAQLAERFDWYRDLDGWTLSPDAQKRDDPALRELAALTVAVCDGISIQYAADPSLDLDAIFARWGEILRLALAALGDAPPVAG